MATLKDIANRCLTIAKITPEAIDYNLKLSTALELFLSSYAKRVRDDINKGRPQEQYVMSYEVTLEYDETRKVLKSENKVYTPIRTNLYSPFQSVGSDDGRVVLQYVSKNAFWSYALSPFMINIVGYTYDNGYLYVLNNNKFSHVEVTAAFELPYLLSVGNNEIQKLERGEELDSDFPCPQDMLNSIVAEVASMLINQPLTNG